MESAEKILADEIDYLREQGLTNEEILDLTNKLLRIVFKEEIKIPFSVFKNEHLSSLETIVKYLRENLLLTKEFSQSMTEG